MGALTLTHPTWDYRAVRCCRADKRSAPAVITGMAHIVGRVSVSAPAVQNPATGHNESEPTRKDKDMFDTLAKAGKYLGQAAKMMVGVPDYDNYVEHMRVNHPDQTPMTYEEFFRERQDARYGAKGGAKCC